MIAAAPAVNFFLGESSSHQIGPVVRPWVGKVWCWPQKMEDFYPSMRKARDVSECNATPFAVVTDSVTVHSHRKHTVWYVARFLPEHCFSRKAAIDCFVIPNHFVIQFLEYSKTVEPVLYSRTAAWFRLRTCVCVFRQTSGEITRCPGHKLLVKSPGVLVISQSLKIEETHFPQKSTRRYERCIQSSLSSPNSNWPAELAMKAKSLDRHDWRPCRSWDLGHKHEQCRKPTIGYSRKDTTSFLALHVSSPHLYT